MNCFTHQEEPAVGVCGACGKGVCAECAVDIVRAISCPGACEHEVRRLLDLRDYSFVSPARAERIYAANKRTNLRTAILMVAFAAPSIAIGIWMGSSSVIALGIMALVLGILLMVQARKLV